MNCQKRVVSGVTTDGGYAEVIIAEARGISSVPDDLKSAKAAPLLCAGITTTTLFATPAFAAKTWSPFRQWETAELKERDISNASRLERL